MPKRTRVDHMHSATAGRAALLLLAAGVALGCQEPGDGRGAGGEGDAAQHSDAAGDVDATHASDATDDVDTSEPPDADDARDARDAADTPDDGHAADADDATDTAEDIVEDIAESDVRDASPAPGAPPSPCAPHFESCDGVCRAIEVDAEHCGACGNRCDDGLVCSLGACVAPAPVAPACSDEKVAEVLAPASPEAPWVTLDCSLTVPEDAVVTKAIRITGPEASGVVLDCQGGRIVRGDPGGGADLVLVESRRVGDVWERPTDVTVRSCRIEGAVRIRGQGNNGQAPAVTDDSWTPGHRERAQAAAPTRVTFESVTIVGDGRIPLYLAPGVTRFTLRDSEIVGESVSTIVYLDAESAYNRFVGNRIAAATRVLLPREEFAIDGSADNLIAGNVFDGVSSGAVYVYRNCGEGGAVRHQEPRRNVVAGNVFRMEGSGWDNPWLWVGSRNEGGVHTLTYCELDDAYDFGSGRDDSDYARDTVVVDNRIIDSPTHPEVHGVWGIELDDAPTYVDGNRVVGAAETPIGAACVVFHDAALPEILREGEEASDGRVCLDGWLVRSPL